MLVFAFIIGVVICTLVQVAPMAVLAVVLVVVAITATSPQERLMHKRRRHAMRTAHAMRRMSRIRARTIRRMDEAEGRWRP